MARCTYVGWCVFWPAEAVSDRPGKRGRYVQQLSATSSVTHCSSLSPPGCENKTKQNKQKTCKNKEIKIGVYSRRRRILAQFNCLLTCQVVHISPCCCRHLMLSYQIMSSHVVISDPFVISCCHIRSCPLSHVVISDPVVISCCHIRSCHLMLLYQILSSSHVVISDHVRYLMLLYWILSSSYAVISDPVVILCCHIRSCRHCML